MKVLNLFFPVVAAISTAATVFSAGIEVMTSGLNASTVKTANNPSIFSGHLCNHLQRRNKGTVSQKKIQFLYNSSVSDLVECVLNDFINFSLFNERRPEIITFLDFLVNVIDKYSPTDAWTLKLIYLQSFIDGMTQALDLKQRFLKCTHWGSDLVETLTETNIRLLALRNLEGPKGNPDFHWKKRRLVHLYEMVLDRGKKDTNMSAGMRSLYDAESQRVDRALAFLLEFSADVVIPDPTKLCSDI